MVTLLDQTSMLSDADNSCFFIFFIFYFLFFLGVWWGFVFEALAFGGLKKEQTCFSSHDMVRLNDYVLRL